MSTYNVFINECYNECCMCSNKYVNVEYNPCKHKICCECFVKQLGDIEGLQCQICKDTIICTNIELITELIDLSYDA